jgi:hypothetical protein
MFVEFPGALGVPVLLNAECIGMITIGSPERLNEWSGVFVDAVRVYFREGFEGFPGDEEKFATFYVDDEYLSYWLEHWREALGIPEFPEGAEPHRKS